MTQTNRSPGAHARSCFSGPAILSVLLALFLLTLLLSACNTSVGAGAGTSSARVGGNVSSTGSMVGIGTSIGPSSVLIVSNDELFNGPSAVRINHKQALKALKGDDYATAASLFEETLKTFPNHPDATYYLGLTRIYQGQREAGFALLKSYRDPNHFRVTKWVQKMAEFLEKKEDITPEAIHRTMNRYRMDAFNQELRDTRDLNVWD